MYLTRLWFKTTCIRLAAYARSRHIDENFQNGAVPGVIWRSSFLLTSYKKVSETVSRKGSLDRPIPVANANKWRVLLRPSKIHNPNHQGPAACVPPPRFSSQKVIIFRTTDGRTDTRFSCPTDGKSASHNYRCKLNKNNVVPGNNIFKENVFVAGSDGGKSGEITMYHDYCIRTSSNIMLDLVI